MKNINYFLLFLLLLNSSLKAQENYDPFQLKGKGFLMLKSGEKYTGISRYRVLNDYVHFFKEFGDVEQMYKIKDVHSFSIGDSIFYAKQTKGAEVSLSKKQTFMLLKTSENGRLKLFERKIVEEEPGLASFIVYSDPKIITDYFIETAEDTQEVFSVTGIKFIPNFSKKVSALVADCPELAKKILDKQEGYAVDLNPLNQLKGLGLGKKGGVKDLMKKSVTPEGTAELNKELNKNSSEFVWFRIIEEYNNCQKN